MRLPTYEWGIRRSQRAFVRLTRALGAELDDVGRASLRRPDFFGKPFLGLAHSLLRGPSAWSVGERELFAAAVSRANSCQFCVATHGEIAAKQLGRDVLERLDEGRFSPPAAAAATFVEALTRDPHSVSAGDLERARAAGVEAPKRCGASATASPASSCADQRQQQRADGPPPPTAQDREAPPNR